MLNSITTVPQFGAGRYRHNRVGCLGTFGSALWWRDVMLLVHVLHMLEQPGRPPLRNNPEIKKYEYKLKKYRIRIKMTNMRWE